MNGSSYKKYKACQKIDLKGRRWPDKAIDKAPIWCSVDLRDGNQALINPMSLEQKIKLFKLLLKLGFKEIEIGFPSASAVEHKFARYLINNALIPDDVSIQVLTQAREHLIKKTRESMCGAKNIIVHLYNSTSIDQRELVFKKDKKEIIELAINGVKWIKKYFSDFQESIRLEYSPESFTSTELEFSRDICNAVIDEWAKEREEKVIINLPATVEISTPNVFADQIEWMCKNLNSKKNIIISIHTHNDRGCAVGAAELGIMAGAQRVEGTLLGNGERTGNVDILTLGLNMFSQGINPKLNLQNVKEIKHTIESITHIKSHPRHPYIGELVFTAFSGSHQDAIKKGMEWQKNNPSKHWRVPYLPIDPQDVGQNYKEIIKINSQSGKGGVVYILKELYGYSVPKKMEPHISSSIQKYSEHKGEMLTNKEVFEVFYNSFINKDNHFNIYNIEINTQEDVYFRADFKIGKKIFKEQTRANGAIEAVSKILKKLGVNFSVVDYYQYILTHDDASSGSIAYFQIRTKNSKEYFGGGSDSNIIIASIKALISGLNVAYQIDR